MYGPLCYTPEILPTVPERWYTPCLRLMYNLPRLVQRLQPAIREVTWIQSVLSFLERVLPRQNCRAQAAIR